MFLDRLPPCQEPVPHIQAHPLPNNLLEWHFVLEGAKGTDFEGGLYHGKLVFPPNYPFKPPSISIFTPNGRFAVNTKLCLSITDFHPESWNPMCELAAVAWLARHTHGQSVSCNSPSTASTAQGQAWHGMALNHHCKRALQAPGVAAHPHSQHAVAAASCTQQPLGNRDTIRSPAAAAAVCIHPLLLSCRVGWHHPDWPAVLHVRYTAHHRQHQHQQGREAAAGTGVPRLQLQECDLQEAVPAVAGGAEQAHSSGSGGSSHAGSGAAAAGVGAGWAAAATTRGPAAAAAGSAAAAAVAGGSRRGRGWCARGWAGQ